MSKPSIRLIKRRERAPLRQLPVQPATNPNSWSTAVRSWVVEFQQRDRNEVTPASTVCSKTRCPSRGPLNNPHNRNGKDEISYSENRDEGTSNSKVCAGDNRRRAPSLDSRGGPGADAASRCATPGRRFRFGSVGAKDRSRDHTAQGLRDSLANLEHSTVG